VLVVSLIKPVVTQAIRFFWLSNKIDLCEVWFFNWWFSEFKNSAEAILFLTLQEARFLHLGLFIA